jgi:hypothetical protein
LEHGVGQHILMTLQNKSLVHWDEMMTKGGIQGLNDEFLAFPLIGTMM